MGDNLGYRVLSEKKLMKQQRTAPSNPWIWPQPGFWAEDEVGGNGSMAIAQSQQKWQWAWLKGNSKGKRLNGNGLKVTAKARRLDGNG